MAIVIVVPELTALFVIRELSALDGTCELVISAEHSVTRRRSIAGSNGTTESARSELNGLGDVSTRSGWVVGQGSEHLSGAEALSENLDLVAVCVGISFRSRLKNGVDEGRDIVVGNIIGVIVPVGHGVVGHV